MFSLFVLLVCVHESIAGLHQPIIRYTENKAAEPFRKIRDVVYIPEIGYPSHNASINDLIGIRPVVEEDTESPPPPNAFKPLFTPGVRKVSIADLKRTIKLLLDAQRNGQHIDKNYLLQLKRMLKAELAAASYRNQEVEEQQQQHSFENPFTQNSNEYEGYVFKLNDAKPEDSIISETDFESLKDLIQNNNPSSADKLNMDPKYDHIYASKAKKSGIFEAHQNRHFDHHNTDQFEQSSNVRSQRIENTTKNSKSKPVDQDSAKAESLNYYEKLVSSQGPWDSDFGKSKSILDSFSGSLKSYDFDKLNDFGLNKDHTYFTSGGFKPSDLSFMDVKTGGFSVGSDIFSGNKGYSFGEEKQPEEYYIGFTQDSHYNNKGKHSDENDSYYNHEHSSSSEKETPQHKPREHLEETEEDEPTPQSYRKGRYNDNIKDVQQFEVKDAIDVHHNQQVALSKKGHSSSYSSEYNSEEDAGGYFTKTNEGYHHHGGKQRNQNNEENKSKPRQVHYHIHTYGSKENEGSHAEESKSFRSEHTPHKDYHREKKEHQHKNKKTHKKSNHKHKNHELDHHKNHQPDHYHKSKKQFSDDPRPSKHHFSTLHDDFGDVPQTQHRFNRQNSFDDHSQSRHRFNQFPKHDFRDSFQTHHRFNRENQFKPKLRKPTPPQKKLIIRIKT